MGVGFFGKILDRKLGAAKDGTVIMNTNFGMVMLGEHAEEFETRTGRAFTVIDDSLGDKLNGMIEQLWKQDEIESERNTESQLTEDQQMVEDHFMATHYRQTDGRFVVKIPFKPGVDYIGSSRNLAIRQFYGTERRMERFPAVREFYIEQMRELMRIGGMVEVTREPTPGKICYHIPHHCITKKPRVVYNASCKTNTGVSLNEIQMLGAKLQTEMHTTLMRFRRHRVAGCGDVRKMFNQIKIAEDQWDCQRIFWRENSDLPLKEYWLTVVTFGLTSFKSCQRSSGSLSECRKNN